MDKPLEDYELQRNFSFLEFAHVRTGNMYCGTISQTATTLRGADS